MFYRPLTAIISALPALLILLSCSNTKSMADSPEPQKSNLDVSPAYFDDNVIEYTNKIYEDRIKTLIVHTTASELEPPVINLDGDERIVLRFDDLGEDIRNLYYSFEHCTFDWKSSELQQMDFQEGFNSDFINDYTFSFNTVQNYTHYRVEFPNDRIKLTRSGNYIVKVFVDDDHTKPVVTARFMVVETKSNIDMTIRPSSIVSERDYKQEVDLVVNLGNVETLNPYREIELVVLQNFRWDNAKFAVKPSFIKDSELTYNYQNELTFDGTNEFRFIDAKSVRYRSEQVQEVVLRDDGYHIILSPDIRRAFRQYTFQDDINGRLLIKNDDMQDAHLESDYVTVHFTMPVDAPLGNGDLYLFGQLSNWILSKDYRLTYNPATISYDIALRLKQGYYNYMYLWRYKNRDSGMTELTEGTHSQTENEYTVLVYYRDPRAFADRLVGYKISSTFIQ